MLELRILGQFDVQVDGETIDISSRPAQSLFAYLCFHPGVQHRREKLAGMLWPDSDESNARSNLRHALWRLGEGVGKEVFVADKLSISIDSDVDVWVDVAAFEADSEDDTLESVLSAVQLYQGELLPGFYEDWVELERERLRAVYDRKIERLISLQLDAGRWAASIQWSERWIAQGHVPETAFRSLMIAYRALGDSAKIASTYDRCRTILRQELDVEPSAETTKLFVDLTHPGSGTELDRSAPSEPIPGKADAGRSFSPKPSRNIWLEEGVTEAFVGRESQLMTLDRMLAASLQGQGRLAMIVGEAGTGKTTLAAAFARRALSAGSDVSVAMGRCDVYTGGGNPYAPFQEVLGCLLEDASGAMGNSREGDLPVEPATGWIRERVMAFPPDLVGSLIPQQWLSASMARSGGQPQSWTGAVGRIMGAEVGSESPAALHRNRVLEAYSEVLLEYSTRRPLVMVLDDLHWIDPSSASLLRFFVSQIRSSRVLLIGTYRPDEVSSAADGSPHPLADVLPELKRIFGDVWLDVEQSDLEGAKVFVDQMLQSLSVDAEVDFRKSLTTTTRGHPFFVRELIKDLQERGGLVETLDGLWVESEEFDLGVLPTRVEAVVEARIARLEAELQEAASIASVQGDEFVAEVVAEVQGVDPGALVRRLTEELGREHRLVEELGTERVQGQLMTRFAFRHVLIQKYLYQRLGKGERAYLHEATGLVLERLYEESEFPPASQLARHFVGAGMAPKAARYLQLAGEQALRVSAYPEAISHLLQAREIQQNQVGEGNSSILPMARVERLLGEAHYGLGDITQGAAYLEKAVSLLGMPLPNGDPRIGLGLARQVVIQALHLGLSRLLPTARLDGEPIRQAALAFKLLAEIYLVRNQTLLTLYAGLRGLNLAERSGSAPEMARAYADATVIAPLLRMSRLGELYRRKAVAQVAGKDGQRAEAYVQLSTSIFTLGEGNWETAFASLETANRSHEQAGDWNRLGVGIMLLANYYSLRGENERSLETYDRLCSLARRSGNTQHLTWGIDGRAKCLIRRGMGEDVGQALVELGESLEILQAEKMRQEEVEALGFLAYASWSAGDPVAAFEAAESASALLEQSAPNFFSQVEGYAAVVRTFLSAWERMQLPSGKTLEQVKTQAKRAVRALDLLARTFPVCDPRALVWHASLDWMEGRKRAAQKGWRRALERSEELKMPYESGLAQLELGRHLLADNPMRQRHLEQAAQLFEQQSAWGELSIVRGVQS